MTESPHHVADQPDLLAVDAEWRQAYAELIIPMTEHLRIVHSFFSGDGDLESMRSVYEGARKLKADLEELKKHETALLSELRANRDAWEIAITSRSGELGRLDSKVAEQDSTILANEDTISELEAKRHECDEELASLKERMLEAEHALAMTQDLKASLMQEYKDEALGSLSGKEQRLAVEVEEFERRSGEALAEEERRRSDFATRELRLTELEQISNTTRSENSAMTDHLENARSILQSLADGVDSGSNTTPTPVSLDDLATSIHVRFLDYKQASIRKEEDLAARQTQVLELGKRLEDTKRRIENLQNELINRGRELAASRQIANSLPVKDIQLQQAQDELREQNDELMIQRDHGVELENKWATANRLLDGLRATFNFQKEQLDASRKETARLAGKDLQVQHVQAELHEKDKVLISQQEDSIKLENRLDTANGQLELLQFSYNDQNRQLENVRKAALRLSAKESQLKQVRLELSEALASLEQVTRQKDGLKDAVEVLEDNLKEAQAAKDEGAKQFGETKQGLSDSRTGCAVLRSRNEYLQAQLDAAFKVRDEQAKDLVELVTDIIPVLRSSEQSRVQENDELKSDNTYLRQRAEQGESEAKALQTLNDELNTSRNRAIEICAVERKTVTSLRNENHIFREQASTYRNRADEFDSSLTTERHKLAGLEESCRTKEAEIERFKATHSLTGAKAAGLSSEVSQKKDVIADLNRRLDDLQTTKSKESERNTAAFIEKDDQIQQLTQHAQVLQSTIKAEAEKFTLELSSKDGRIGDLARKLELLEVTTNAEKEQIVADSNAKDKRFKELSDSKDTEIACLHQKAQELQTTTKNECKKLRIELSGKDQEIADLSHELEELQSTANAEAAEFTNANLAKDQELEQLRKEVKELRSVGRSNDFDLRDLRQRLDDLRKRTSERINDLILSNNSNINDATDLRRQMRELQSVLDGERASVQDLSEKSTQQMRDLEQKQRRILAQNTEIAEMGEVVERAKQELDNANSTNQELQDRIDEIEEYELDQIKQLKEDLDQLKGRVSRRNTRITELESEKARLTERLEKLTEERDALQEEVDRYEQREDSDEVEDVQRRTSALSTGRPSRQSSVDQEEDMLDKEITPQQISKGVTGHNRQAESSRGAGRKRKSSEMASNGGEEASGYSKRPHGQDTTHLAQTDSQQTSAASATWSIRDIRDNTYVPNPPIPPAILKKLRNKMSLWDTAPRDWTIPPRQRRCVEAMVAKKKAVWSHGEGHKCDHCTKSRELCVVVGENAKITLLPVWESSMSVEDDAYWMN